MEISREDKEKFPIHDADKFCELFECHIERAISRDSEPSLAFLSILLGYLESRLTLTKNAEHHTSSAELDDLLSQRNSSKIVSKDDEFECDADQVDASDEDDFPTLDFCLVEAMYLKFCILVKSIVDKTSTDNTTRSGYATGTLCKKVSDLVWNRLNPHYHKDKAHIQSLFSFLTGRQLDCFGLAFVVIAACQVLRYNDVHLAMSEDHAWAAHGDNYKSWMYLNGNGVICTRLMEVAAMIISVNPAIDARTDSETMVTIQHRLLKFVYQMGALDRYPLGLGLLAELENSEELHKQAVKCVETHYDGSHVFPYCSQGQFYLRNGNYKAAVSCWSKAAQVLSNYNYTREDEEVYREIMEIAKELIPAAMKAEPSIIEDKNCFLDLIKFYDGICLWEEDSSTPVLHSWWAKYFTHTLGRFPAEVRETFKDFGRKEKKEANGVKGRKHSLRNEEPSGEDDACVKQYKSTLGVESSKMKGLEELLVGSKKFNAHTVSLQLTAQSQVHLSRRHLNSGSESTTEYSGRIKKPKKFFE